MYRLLPALFVLVFAAPAAADPWMGLQFGMNRVTGDPESFGDSAAGSDFEDTNWTIGLSAGYTFNPYAGLVFGVREHDLDRTWSSLSGTSLRGRSTYAGGELSAPLGSSVSLVGGAGLHQWDATVRRDYGGERSDSGMDLYYSGAIRFFPDARANAELQVTRYLMDALEVDAFTLNLRLGFGGRPD